MSKIRRFLPFTALPLALLAACTTATKDDTHQLRALVDRNEITGLLNKLGRALDEGRFEDFRTIYTAEATAQTPGGRAEGRDALIAQASRNHSGDRRIQHFITNVMIDLHRDTAEVRANLIATFAPATTAVSEPQYTLGEIYRFDAVRTEEGWRLSRVETTPLWSTGTRP